MHFTSREDVIQAINEGMIDAVFCNIFLYNFEADLDALGDPDTTCMLDGAGMTVRKDSRLPDWWNPAFDQLKESSEYQRICDEVTTKHSQSEEEIACID
ncbi:uncharacterized protein LOC110982114 [Acanthaster planci]|uniref:Uncharacterized protein LOC110982114 n=1 Tax=Acanthaster planci TaxID=133434 RepID=A0A8B7YRT3_ACAPL|nr:uncharacterized protein LOC110982114 [Acanthaster planci]